MSDPTCPGASDRSKTGGGELEADGEPDGRVVEVQPGEVSIFDGTRWNTTRAGDYVHVPPGGLHGFRNESGAASMLLHFAPGAPREGYFEGLARVAAGETMTDQERDEFMRHHDNHWVD